MLKRNWKKVMKSRKTVWVLLFCLIAGAAAGTVYKNTRPENDIENAADADSVIVGNQNGLQVTGEDENTGNDPETNEDGTVVPEKNGQIQADAGNNTNTENKEDGKASDQKNAENEEAEQAAEDAAPAASIIKAENLDFLTESKMSWPVEGEVLLEFNMDETIYFPTLNLYKCNQAMVIQAETGTPVCAPAEGIIVSIGMDEQIGNYMVMDVGDGFQIKMGQLKDIKVSEGTQVKEGDLLAYIASPTNCYSVEGDNLYLEVTENGTPVDPLDYLKY